jgi:Cu+-exporting ATPase
VISGYFVPAVLGLPFLAAGDLGNHRQGFNFVLNIFVTVLVIACPVRAGATTPTASWSAPERARNGRTHEGRRSAGDDA